MALVFGSMASGTEGARSDIDLMIVGDVTYSEVIDAIYDTQAQPGRKINPKVLSHSEWLERKAAGSTFVQDVLAKPKIMLIGDARAL